MKTHRILTVSILIAGSFACIVVAIFVWFKLSPDLEKMLEGSFPSLAGMLFSIPGLKDFLLKGHPEIGLFLIVFFLTTPTAFVFFKFLWPRLFPETPSPFITLAAFKNRRGQEFTILPFVGRTAELAKLNAFAQQHPGQFRWWVLRGEPGTGKTRLAVEWAQTLKGWDVNVLKPKFEADALKHWRPRRPCLILVDEFAMRKDDIERLTDDLLQRDKQLRQTVRLLLMDWAKPDWLESKTGGLLHELSEGEPLLCTDWDRKTYNTSLPLLWPKELAPLDAKQEERLFEFSDGNLLVLSRLLALTSQSDNFQIRRHTGRDCRYPGYRDVSSPSHPWNLGSGDPCRNDGNSLNSTLMPTQPARRELFRTWSKDVLQGLKDKGMADDYLPLVALAAWCGGYPWAMIDVTRTGYPGGAPQRFYKLDLQALPNPPGRTIPALTPETLAVEYALLELLNHEATDRHWLRRLAWEGNPQGTARSLWWLHRLQLQGLLNEEEQELLTFLDTSPAETGCAETAQAEAVGAWETLQAGLLGEAEERKQQAGNLMNSIHAHGEKGELEAMAAKFQELRGLTEAWPGDREVKRAFAARLECTANHYGEFNQLDAMSTALDELRSLALAHPYEPEIQLELAKGLVNATHYYGDHGDLHAMASALDELRTLALGTPNESEFHLQLAVGLYNASLYYGNHGNLPAMASALDELRTLAHDHYNEQKIQLELAKGLFNSTNYYGKHGDLIALASALDELRSLALAHTNESEFHLQLARGLYNAFNYYGNRGDLTAMASALDDLRSLSLAHPNDSEFQLQLANALHNQAIYDPEYQSSAIAELKTIACCFPTHDGIQQQAYEWGVSYVQQQIAKKEALERIAELKTLAWRFPTQDGIHQ